MKAIEITEFGAPDVLKLGERPMPEPKAGEVLIKVTASGVNRLRDQPGKSKVIVLLTDGENNSGSITPDAAAQAAKALGVK